jgi:hypothetical protein
MRKRPKQYLTNLFKHAGMGAIILTAFYLAGFWVTQFTTNSQAAQEKINVILAPKSNPSSPYKLNEAKTVNLILKPKNSAKDISAFKVVLMKEGVLDIVGIGEPGEYPNLGTQSDFIFTKVGATVNSATYVVVAKTKKNELPHAVRIPVQIKGTAKGDGGLKLDTSQSSIVGNISGSQYEFGSVDIGSYKFR